MLSGAREYNSLSVSPHNEPIKIGLAEDILSQNINLSHSSESAALLPARHTFMRFCVKIENIFPKKN